MNISTVIMTRAEGALFVVCLLKDYIATQHAYASPNFKARGQNWIRQTPAKRHHRQNTFFETTQLEKALSRHDVMLPFNIDTEKADFTFNRHDEI